MGLGGSSRTFDINIVLVDETQMNGECQFINLDQIELKVMMRYFKNAKIKMREIDVESRRGNNLDDDEIMEKDGYDMKKKRGVKGQNDEEEDEEDDDYDSEEDDEDFNEKDVKEIQKGEKKDNKSDE